MFFLESNEFIGNLASVTTILQFLSGILVCKQYVVNRTTAEASSLPFISGFLCCFLWLLYGITKDDEKVQLVNVVGVCFMAIYNLVFYKYTHKKIGMIKQIFVAVGIMVLIILYVSYEEDSEKVLKSLGILACLFTLLTIASPLSKLFYVLRVKNTECLPFPMILMSFFVSTLWFVYGLNIGDIFIQVPNIIGSVLAGFQLLLFVLYPNAPQSPLISKSSIA